MLRHYYWTIKEKTCQKDLYSVTAHDPDPMRETACCREPHRPCTRASRAPSTSRHGVDAHPILPKGAISTGPNQAKRRFCFCPASSLLLLHRIFLSLFSSWLAGLVLIGAPAPASSQPAATGPLGGPRFPVVDQPVWHPPTYPHAAGLPSRPLVSLLCTCLPVPTPSCGRNDAPWGGRWWRLRPTTAALAKLNHLAGSPAAQVQYFWKDICRQCHLAVVQS